MKNVAVIGGGLGGIASAIRFRSRGYEVSLYERLDALGGRAQKFIKDGYLHDAGPTVITAPYLFEELFSIGTLIRNSNDVPKLLLSICCV